MRCLHARDCIKGVSDLYFLCQRRQKTLGGSGDMLHRENFFNLHFSNRWKCTVESAILVFSCCLLREPAYLLLLSAWANISAYTSYINVGSPEETRKLVTNEHIEHWVKFIASEGTNSEFMSTSESSKKSANVWEMLVLAWEHEIELKCMRLMLIELKCMRLKSSARVPGCRPDEAGIFYRSQARGAGGGEYFLLMG